MVWDEEEKPGRKPTEKNWVVKQERNRKVPGAEARGEEAGLIKSGKCHRHQGGD